MNRMPSPAFGASKMPLSTSLNSSTELPWASTSRRKSLSFCRQPAICGTNGNSLTQPGSNSSRLPTLIVSLRNVSVQIFSRSALENSQLPIIVRGGGGAGSVTGSSAGGSCAASGVASAISRANANGALRVMRAKLSRPLVRRPGRLGHRREQRLAVGPGQQVVHGELFHLLPRVDGGRAQMREQHDVV